MRSTTIQALAVVALFGASVAWTANIDAPATFHNVEPALNVNDNGTAQPAAYEDGMCLADEATLSEIEALLSSIYEEPVAAELAGEGTDDSRMCMASDRDVFLLAQAGEQCVEGSGYTLDEEIVLSSL